MRHSENPEEIETAQFLTSEPLLSNTSNHCVPIYDTFPVPDDDDIVIMVMPLLRMYTSPPFHTVGEVVECFRQIFEVTIVFILSYCVSNWLTRAFSSCIRIGSPTGELF